jgi:hypothetical protein
MTTLIIFLHLGPTCFNTVGSSSGNHWKLKAVCITFNYLILNFKKVPDDDPTGSKHVVSRCKNNIRLVM